MKNILDEHDNLKYLIEFNGKQHYDFSKFMHVTDEYFKECNLKDQLKIDYCNNKNIKLHIIKFDDNIKNCMTKIINNHEKENI